MEQALARIKAARAGGQQVTADIYPYVNNGLGLESFLHPRHAGAGGRGAAPQARRPGDPSRDAPRDGIDRRLGKLVQARRLGLGQRDPEPDPLRRNTPATPGKSLGQIAREAGKDPWDVFFTIVASAHSALPRSMSEANVVKALRRISSRFAPTWGRSGAATPWSIRAAQGLFRASSARYVRELEIVPLERAIARMTSVAANDLKLYDRGRIAPGAAADLVVFDADRVRDRSTFAEPNLTAEGIIHVLVNGQFVIEQGKTTPALPGRVLRRPGRRGVVRKPNGPHRCATPPRQR